MNEAIQHCISKLKATGTHVSTEEIVTNTNSGDVTPNNDPQATVLESSEVCTYTVLVISKLVNFKP